MEWREQSTVSCEVAFAEAQRWVEVVTKKTFGNNNFRSALEDGVLLCDLINRIKPGIIKRVNRLSTPIAGLDNVNVFLKACGKLGLKEAQLFHPGDLQDLSTRVTVKHEETNRRLKNVLITIYWLGRKAQVDPVYDGPYLNLRAFEGLLGIALSKALEDSTVPRGSVRDSGFGDSWYADKEELFPLQSTHKREDSLDSLDSVESRTLSISSDATLKGSSEGCGSDADAEAELGFRMAENKDSLQYRRSLVVEPKTSMQFNQFLPSKDKPSGYVPAPLRRKRAERHEDNRRSWANPTYTEEDRTITSEGRAGTSPSPQNGCSSPQAAAPLQWAYEYESESGSDVDRPEPDLELDDLASRRFRSPSPVAPANYAVPMSPRVLRAPQPLVTVSNPPRQTLAYPSSASPSPPPSRRLAAEDIPLRDLYDDSEEDEDEDVGYADPVQDDLYARKVGLVLQPSTNVPYDKFLPKFWTPEEDAHVQKIKLGSQSRPWYRKMQGFSRAKSGSSSEDSDCDVSPWLCAATPARPQSDTHSNHPHAPEGPARSQLLPAQSPHMQPHTVSQALSYPHHTYPPHTQPRRDPSAGPRLIRCERGSFLGPACPDDPRSVPPDLENDDMFARRTRAFHGSTHSGASKRESPVSARPDAPQVRIVTQPRRGEPVLPDIERDDLLFRKLNPPRPVQPLSGAPDRFNAVPIPEPWALPPKLGSNLLCIPCPPTSDEEPTPDRKGEEHPKSDDMLMRKLGVGHPSTATQAAPTVPSFSSEDDMRKWQAIREAGRQRYKKRLMVERLLQKRSGSEGSKSVSDIPLDMPGVQQLRYEDLQRIRAKVKENEDSWQDDLNKWKNRRRSVNSDIVKKKEEREQIELVTGGSGTRRSRAFKEMQEEREGKEPTVPSNNSDIIFSSSQDRFFQPPQRTKNQLARSYTVDTPYTREGPSAAEKSRVVALSSDRSYTPTSAGQARTSTSQSTAILAHRTSSLLTDPSSASNASETGTNLGHRTSSLLTDPSSASNASETGTNLGHRTSSLLTDPSSASNASETGTNLGHRTSSLLTDPSSASNASETGTNLGHRTSSLLTDPSSATKTEVTVNKAPESRRPFGRLEEQPPAPLYKHNSMDTKPGEARVSASLPRGYQRSDSSRLSSVVTPRPFGSQSTRISSLPRVFAMDDSHKRLNGEAVDNLKPGVPSRYGQVLTSEDEARSQSSSVQSSNEDEEEEDEGHPSSVARLPRPVSSDCSTVQESHSDMRISLNQKPNSNRDFGFQANWDSTGARVKSIQQGSPAELCHLQVGDEILAVGGRRASEMSYQEWKASMEGALQHGSLVLDIRRHGNSAPDKHVNTGGDFSSRQSSETAMETSEVSSQPVNDLASKGINGSFRDDIVTLRNKESELISLRNLKRRSEFFEKQGGSESAISDLQVPSISTSSSNRWSWDPEEERRRQEKWQQEQERLLQEKYKRDQEKLEEEWRRAQQEAFGERSGHDQEQIAVNNWSPHSSEEPSQPEAERGAEQEAQKDAARLREAVTKRRQQQEEEEERRRRERQAELQRQKEEREKREEELRWQRKKDLEEQHRLQEEEKKRLQQAVEEEEKKRLQQAVEEEEMQEQWPGDSHGFAKILPEISISDRAKSKSTPELDDVEKPKEKGSYSRQGGMAQWLLEEELRRKKDAKAQRLQAVSELEAERRNILNAMRYRDPERAASSSTSEASWTRDSKKKKGQQLSQAEQERQQILQEMKKKTQLLTDNSWIRQRSASVHKEPASLAGPIRRGESLDNLDAARSWRPTSWSSGSASSTSNYNRLHSTASGYIRSGSSTLPTSFSTGSLRQGPWSQSTSTSPTPPASINEETASEQQQNSARAAGPTSEDPNREPKSEYETGSSTATPAMSDTKLGSPPPCDLTTLQQIEEETT